MTYLRISGAQRAGKATAARNFKALEEALRADKWEQDRYGHWHVTVPRKKADGTVVNVELRVKVSATSFRLERAWRDSQGVKQWTRFGGGYYINLVLQENGQVRMGVHTFGPGNGKVMP